MAKKSFPRKIVMLCEDSGSCGEERLCPRPKELHRNILGKRRHCSHHWPLLLGERLLVTGMEVATQDQYWMAADQQVLPVQASSMNHQQDIRISQNQNLYFAILLLLS